MSKANASRSDDCPAGGGSAQPLEAGNLLVAGVGGQGVILASNLISQVLLDAGHDVKKSEVHGMSQRGGTVVSHVRFGPEVHSVMIEPGSADWIVAFEWEEGLRALSFLKPDGIALISSERRIPPAAMLDHRSIVLDYPAQITVPPGVFVVDTFAVAGDAAAKAPVIAQTVLLGALSVLLPFSAEAWQAAITAWVPAKAVVGNLAAFDRGRELATEVEAVRSGQSVSAIRRPAGGSLVAEPAHSTQEQLIPTVNIERNWCKGCNICVAVCPEKCLMLDKFDVAVFAHPERCTGCRLCDWLCPDLAIDVVGMPAAALGDGGSLHEEDHVRATARPR
ncbi:MAG: 2-oxoacid:acceptor oxidoreductase family protein [Acidimicrobiales bacterium]